MKNMTLTAIAEVCNGQLFGYDWPEKEVAGVVLDSRKVEKDYLFIATVGERVDGHSFIDDVFGKGALAVICEKVPSNPKGTYIVVDNSFVALKKIAMWYRMQLDLVVVGITGSVGKTSTKEFISSVLSQNYKVLKTEGNHNNEVGLPLTILNIQDQHQVAVLEMGISEFGEMHRLSEIAKPDICVLTNIGQCHLENLGSREGILKAKSEIFDFMNEEGYVCINGDDDMLSTIKEVKGKKPIKFGMNKKGYASSISQMNSKSGISYQEDNSNEINEELDRVIACEMIDENNDVYASHIQSHGLFGSSCDIHVNDTSFHVNIPLPGSHMILNALAATSVGLLLQMNCSDIARGIEMVQPVGGRSNIIRKENLTIIDDCYNANPQSMKAALDLLAMADTNKVAILGDMFELGISEHELHKEIGAYAAEKNIDILVCVGKLSSHMYDGAFEKVTGKLLYFETRDELIDQLSSIIKQNDTVLIKASHGMGFEHVVKALL